MTKRQVLPAMFLVVSFTATADGMLQPDPQSVHTASPLTIAHNADHPQRGPVIELAFDQQPYHALQNHQTVTLTDFVLPGRARHDPPRTVDVHLQRMNVLSDNAQVTVSDPHEKSAKRELPRPQVSIFRGRIADSADSRVYLSMASHGAVHGYVVKGDTLQHVLSSSRPGLDHPIVIYTPDALQPGLLRQSPWDCHIASNGIEERTIEGISHQKQSAAQGRTTADPPCRQVEVAIETDYEFTHELFDGDMNAAAEYVLTLMGAASEIFSNDTNVELEVVFINLWDEPGGPTSLGGFQSYWMENMTHVERDLAHLFAASGSGGVAFLWGVCDEEFGYAASFGLNGSFPYPLEDFSTQNWDPIVVTHEFGHNFGAPHTHNYCPPLDKCSQIGGGLPAACVDQVVCQDGTIMGYCHLCSGGLSNVALTFHPIVRLTILDYLETVTECELEIDGGCELADPPPKLVHVPDDVPTIMEALWIVADGGEILVAPGTYHEQLGFSWSFTFQNIPIVTSKSVHVKSTDGPEQTVIEGFGQPGSILTFLNTGDVNFTIEGFTITGGSDNNGGGAYVDQSTVMFIDCTFTDNTASVGGAVYLTHSDVAFASCSFQDNSADYGGGIAIVNLQSQGSIVIEDSLFEDNVAISEGGGVFNIQGDPTITGSTFRHNTANDGGAIRNLGENSAETVIADSLFCENEPDAISGEFMDEGGNIFAEECNPADLNGDGIVDVLDLLILISEWGECKDPDDCPADLTGPDGEPDGVVDVVDLLKLLSNWGL